MAPSMEWWQALVLGLVEGLTEYLPVSSTGHLILAQRALGIGDDAASRAYAICIQGGAIAAVFSIYLPRIRSMLAGITRGDEAGRRLTTNLALAFVPAVVIGLALEGPIDAHLFGLWPVVAAWLAGGLAILVWEPRRRVGAGTLESLGARAALAIGLWQCLALWPGVSRSLATIAGGLVLGLSMAAAVEFGVLLGLVTLLAATGYKALKHGGEIVEHYGALNALLGFVVAWVSAWIAVKWMVAWLERRGLALFGWYRVVLALVVGGWLLWGTG